MTYREMLMKYGDKEVIFSSYYKYNFIFKGENDLEICVGGDSDDIYKFSVEAGKKYKVAEIEPRSVYIGETCIYSGLLTCLPLGGL